MREIFGGTGRTPNDETRASDPSRIGDAYVVNAEVHAGRSRGERDIDTTMNNDGHRELRRKRSRDVHDRARAVVWKTQLDHRRATAYGGSCSAQKADYAVTQVVRDCHKAEGIALHDE